MAGANPQTLLAIDLQPKEIKLAGPLKQGAAITQLIPAWEVLSLVGPPKRAGRIFPGSPLYYNGFRMEFRRLLKKSTPSTCAEAAAWDSPKKTPRAGAPRIWHDFKPPSPNNFAIHPRCGETYTLSAFNSPTETPRWRQTGRP